MNTKTLFKTAIAALLTLVLFSAQVLAQGNYYNNGTYTNSGTATFKNYTNGGSAVTTNTGTMKFKATLTQSNADVTKFDTRTGSMEYIGVDATQPIIANVHTATYKNLAARNGGTKTLQNDLVVTQVVTSDKGTGATNDVLDISTYKLTVPYTSSAPIVSAGSGGNFTFTGGTVEYSGTANQTVYPTSYGTLTLSSASGTPAKAANGNLTVGTALNVDASNTLDVQGAANTFLATGVIFTNAGTIKVEGVATFTAGVTIGGLFEYYGLGQTVGSANYTNLALSGASGVKLFGGNTSVAGNYTITHAGTRDYNAKTFTYNGTGGSQTVAADDYTTSSDLIFANTSTKTFGDGSTSMSATASTVNVLSGSGAFTITAAATLTIGTTPAFGITGALTVASVAGLVNQGTLYVYAPVATPGSFTISGATSTLDNQLGAQLTLTNADFTNGGVVTNAGTITVE